MGYYAAEARSELTVDDPIVVFVRGLFPSVVVERDSRQETGVSTESYHIELPAPLGADYAFILWLGGSEKQISARLTSGERAYFWYRPFEEAEFRSAEELDKAYLEAVELIMHHSTRIEQKRGWFFN